MIPFLFRNKFLKIFLISFCLLFSMYLKAQEQNFPFQNFQNITTANGLSNNEVLSLIQDHNGFMWFATSYGLCRYDGYNFKNYYYNPADSN